MNKEEYKCQLAKQLNTPGSAIRALIFQRDPLTRTDMSNYETNGYFIVDSLDLRFALHRLMDKNGNDYWEVKFGETIDLTGKAEYPFIHIESANFKNRITSQYYVETVDYINEKIIFSLTILKLELIEGFPRYNDEYRGFQLIFNPSTCKFDESPEAIALMLETWKKFRAKPSTIYVDLSMNKGDKNKMRDFLTQIMMKSTDKKMIESAFTKLLSNSARESTMAYVVKSLEDIQN